MSLLVHLLEDVGGTSDHAQQTCVLSLSSVVRGNVPYDSQKGDGSRKLD
jgi:hypothetical protein